MQSVKIAIVGRPNVGKSTLFNRILGKNIAIIEDMPGVTRDWHDFQTTYNGVKIIIIDSPGIDCKEIIDRMDPVIHDVDVVLFMTDGSASVVSDDNKIATWLRNSGVKIIPLSNKCDDIDNTESSSFGFGVPICVSAKHGSGMRELLSEIIKYAHDDDDEIHEKGIQITFMGRPNVGKSSLINACIGSPRMLVSEKAGTTRDAVVVRWQYDGVNINLVDTAGMRKIANINDSLEKMSCAKSFRAMMFSHVAILVIDATEGIGHQEIVILNKIIHEGRAIVIVANKWDLIDKSTQKDKLLDIQESIPFGYEIQVITASATKKFGVDNIWPVVIAAYKNWNKTIDTGPLNRVIQNAIKKHTPPNSGRFAIKIKYATQTKTRPQTFVIFGNKVDELPDSYKRYLIKNISKEFDLASVPFRLLFKKADNPYGVN